MMAQIFVAVICVFALLKLLKYFINMAVVHAYLREKNNNSVSSPCSMLILIPVIPVTEQRFTGPPQKPAV